MASLSLVVIPGEHERDHRARASPFESATASLFELMAMLAGDDRFWGRAAPFDSKQLIHEPTRCVASEQQPVSVEGCAVHGDRNCAVRHIPPPTCGSPSRMASAAPSWAAEQRGDAERVPQGIP